MTNENCLTDVQVMYNTFKELYERCLASKRGSKERSNLGYYNDMMNWCVRLGAVES